MMSLPTLGYGLGPDFQEVCDRYDRSRLEQDYQDVPSGRDFYIGCRSRARTLILKYEKPVRDSGSRLLVEELDDAWIVYRAFITSSSIEHISAGGLAIASGVDDIQQDLSHYQRPPPQKRSKSFWEKRRTRPLSYYKKEVLAQQPFLAKIFPEVALAVRLQKLEEEGPPTSDPFTLKLMQLSRHPAHWNQLYELWVTLGGLP